MRVPARPMKAPSPSVDESVETPADAGQTRKRRERPRPTSSARPAVNEQLLNKVLSCPKLPTLPAVALRVVELTGDDNISMAELARVIEHDQGLAARILRSVNSAFYGLPTQCSTLTHAQSLLGLDAVRTLALGFSVVQSLKGAGEEFDYEAHWRRAIYTAIAAKTTARLVRRGDAEEVFLGGLLQDMGVIALVRSLGEEYIELAHDCDGDHHALVKAELKHFELQHPDVGAMLAERWRFPGALIAPIKYHERPSAAPVSARDPVRMVALGNLVADVLTMEDRAHWLSEFYQRATLWFSLTTPQADEIIETVTANARELASMFDLNLGAAPRAEDIQELASERLASIALTESRRAAEAVAESEEARRALMVDALTGLGSRSAFLQRVSALHEAREGDDPLSVILLDADGFRSVNEELGEETGDAVLAHLGQRIAAIFAPIGAETFRYGGEEFGVALPGLGRAEAAALADRARQEIASSAVDAGPALAEDVGPVRLTVSVGVATADAETGTVLNRAERLIHAADKAVDAAKRAGGDCVRAFTPTRRRAA